MNDYDDILNYWFGGLDDQKMIDRNSPVVKKWFSKNEKIDREIHECFEKDFLNAKRGRYKNWEDDPRGRLALILLFDQFSRNMYRETPKMFETDFLALDLTVRAMNEALDGLFKLVERIFLYMPLMHAEDLKIQKLSLEYFGRLITESREKSPQNTSYYVYTFQFAQRHHDIVERFSRFPHRNAILKRESTPGELEFLRNPKSSF